MNKIFLLILTGCVFNQNISAQFYKKDAGLAHTFSIVARDPVSGEMAVGEYGAAMKMFPENLEMKYWTAITLANNKKV